VNQVRGLRDISAISKLVGLGYLSLYGLRSQARGDLGSEHVRTYGYVL